jgi:hypothetical protein
MPAPARCAAHCRRLFRGQILTAPITRKLGDDARHDLAGVANLFSAAEAQREGKRVGEVFGRGGFQIERLGHALVR